MLPLASNIAGNIHDTEHLERVRRSLRLDPHPLRRCVHALMQEGRSDVEAMQRLPETCREPFAAQVALHPLTLVQTQGSTLDGSHKRLYSTAAGDRLESVLLDTPTGRTSLCISSQVGCRAGCRFCATATMPAVTNLSTGEILDQLVQANQHLRPLGRRVRNIVFMGMGEPLHNEAAVAEAIEAITAHDRFNFSPQKIVLSTVGVPEGMRRIAERFPRLRIALSLHHADQLEREQLIPLARRHSLEQLRAAVQDVVTIQNQHVMIQYLLLHGVTDREQDCDALLSWLDGLQCYVNLIPYNPINDGRFSTTPRDHRERFAERLRAAGYMTYIRYSQGADIDAACGQLATKAP
ncbi:MAG: 23S rRNA (adenine(2503)-C(2))-methyltransferase RlmN [Planctomycetales bacterium]|nr:23S rRNA (adenine(2503)-C(2))-methyltransferase RlmN [Planctomycetales bacterium]